MPASPFHSGRLARTRPMALGLIIPLTIAGAASADPRAWVDPPVRTAAAPAPSKGPVAAKSDDALPKAAATPAARLADTQAADGTEAGPASGDRVAAARALAVAYLATVSAPGMAMVGAAPRFYAGQVRFYGRPTTLSALIAQKRSFVRRWPERRYAARTIGSTCAGETCTVRAIVDFHAANAGRGAVSRGAAELVLEVRFSGSRPVIAAETGRVLRRSAQAGTLAPARGRA